MDAPDDAAALVYLLPIPGMRGPKAVALRSTVLMVAEPGRWIPSDQMAYASLFELRDLLFLQVKDNFAPLHQLAAIMSNFQPKPGLKRDIPKVAASDWSLYMKYCRAISDFNRVSLSTVDRALHVLEGIETRQHCDRKRFHFQVSSMDSDYEEGLLA